MALREHIEPMRTARRHSRPRPLGGRFRLPTLRFSGAAMAMSTVVGISLATTWLLNEQQQIGRLPVMSVGASPPLPSPDADGTPTPAPSASSTPAPSASPTGRAPAVRSSRTTSTRPGTHPSATPVQPAVEPPVRSALPDTTPPPSASPTASPTASPPPATTSHPTAPTRCPDRTLTGVAAIERRGRSGTRHTLVLTVGEPMTALQVELRLRRPEILPGTTPWTDLPGAVATVSLDRDTLVYRFTVPAGLDIPEGRYGFAVTGSRLLEANQKLASTVQESWTASAFALDHPRAVATRGTFD